MGNKLLTRDAVLMEVISVELLRQSGDQVELLTSRMPVPLGENLVMIPF